MEIIKPLTLNEIECAIAKYFGTRQNIIVPNISYGFDCHECDLFILKKSGYATEVEIKRSKSDLKADYKKKHQHKDNRVSELYFAIPSNLYSECKDLVPEDAGILTVDKYKGNVVVWTERKPKWNKEARKLTEQEHYTIARLGAMRIWNLKKKLIQNGL